MYKTHTEETSAVLTGSGASKRCLGRIILHAILSTFRLAARQARRSISNRPQVANLPHWVLDQAMRPGTTTPPDSKDRLFMKLGTRRDPCDVVARQHAALCAD